MSKILEKYKISFPYLLLAIMLPLVGIYGSYNAARIAEGDTQTHFHIFWISILIPIAILAGFAFKSSEPYRLWLGVGGLAFITTLPKIFRSGEGPLYHDEYAHLKTVEDLLINGEVYFYNSVVNPAPMFHNMHSLIAGLSEFLGTEVWLTAVISTIILHLSGLFIIALIIKQLGFSNNASFLGAFVYAVNPNWMFFHSQFAYESFGIVFAMLGVLLFIKLIKVTKDMHVLLGALGLGLFSYWLAGLHHLSSIGLLFIILVLLISYVVKQFQSESYSMKNAGLIFVSVFAGASIRLMQDWAFISEYLFSPLKSASEQMTSLLSMLTGSEEAFVRTPFEGGSLPIYEVIASYVAVIVYGLIFVAFLLSFIPRIKNRFFINHKNDLSPEVSGFIMLGSFYFVSVLFILTTSGAEGARRSWGYIFLGLAVMAAWVWDSYLDKPVSPILGFGKSDFKKIIAFFVMPLMFLGGVSTGVNASYRFPVSPYSNTISDLTANSKDSKELGYWFKNNVKEESWVLADRYTKLSLVRNGRVQVPAAYVNFPYWNLYFGEPTEKEKETILTTMYALGVEYIVVDSRMQNFKPELNFWFSRTESKEKYNPGIINSLVEEGILKKAKEVGPFSVYEFELPKEYQEIIDSYKLELIKNFNNAKDLINFVEKFKSLKINFVETK